MQAKPLTRKVKDHRGNEHEVYKWYWMKGWEFYQTEPADEFGVVMGYMTNCPCPEWGSQHEAELHDVAVQLLRDLIYGNQPRRKVGNGWRKMDNYPRPDFDWQEYFEWIKFCKELEKEN